MAEGRYDPLGAFKFRVGWAGIAHAGFQKVTGLGVTVNRAEYREGTDPPGMRKYPGLSNVEEVTLERGFAPDGDKELFSWFELVKPFADSNSVPDPEFRKDIEIQVMDKTGNVIKTYQLFNAWPAEYRLADMDAQSDDPLIASVIIVCEDFNEITS